MLSSISDRSGRRGCGRLMAARAADWLHLCAAPLFATMALLQSCGGDRMHDMLCSGVTPSLLDGMVPMYAAMSVVHLGPWLNLLASANSSAR